MNSMNSAMAVSKGNVISQSGTALLLLSLVGLSACSSVSGGGGAADPLTGPVTDPIADPPLVDGLCNGCRRNLEGTDMEPGVSGMLAGNFKAIELGRVLHSEQNTRAVG